MTRPSNTQMHEQPNSSDHDRHDLLAIAALADRDATGEEAVRAQAQVDTCTECASLHAELVSLASATSSLPAVQRPRDFQLRPEDAQRLRPNRFRRLFGTFGTARDGFSRPLALGLTTLGLAGCCSGSCPARCHSVALERPGRAAAGSAPQQEIQQTLGAAAAPSAAPAAPAREAPLRPQPAASAPAGSGRGLERGYGMAPGTSHQRRRGGRHPAPTDVGSFSQCDRRRTSERHLAVRRFDRRLGADRHLGDVAHHRARAVCPALDLAPLRRLTTGRPARAVPDGSRRDPPVHLGTCPPNV